MLRKSVSNSLSRLLSAQQIIINTSSLLNRVDEIRNVNYIPNNDDILQSRRRTSDIQKLEFQVNLPVKSGSNIRQTFCMFDVGGQRGERRKWIQVFDGVSAVMFLIDSSSFDAIDDENGRNKLRETINLFHEVWTTRFLLNSNFVLLFNKQDILKKKIERGHKIEDHFPEYKHYKCQPQDRALLSRAGEKLNLFRSSGRGSRGSSSRSSTGSTKGASSTSSTREKRKSSLYYRLNNTLSNSSAPAAMETTTNTPDPQETCATTTITTTTTTTTPTTTESPSTTTTTTTTDTTTSSPNNMPSSSSSSTTSSSTANPGSAAEPKIPSPDQAYIRARSFIRDKFLQITRQVDHDQRKFSMPNVMYNSKGCVDQPKRNVCYHYTTATDTENIRDLFENLQKMVIKSTMKNLS